MPRGTTYTVVAYVLARGGKPKPRSTQIFDDPERAQRTAAALGAAKAGAIVLKETETSHDEPRMIWYFGSIPEEMFELI